jgi:hypothetical protein
MSVLEFSDGDWIYEVAVPIDVTVYECLWHTTVRKESISK